MPIKRNSNRISIKTVAGVANVHTLTLLDHDTELPAFLAF